MGFLSYCLGLKVEGEYDRFMIVSLGNICLANRCFLCEKEEETLNQLLVHYLQARILWELILAIVGIGWVFPFSVLQVLLAWQRAQVGKKRKKVWRAAPICLFWTLWHERNSDF